MPQDRNTNGEGALSNAERQARYRARQLDVLPDSQHGSATAEALQAIADLDLIALADIEPPRGYGRD